MPVRNFMKRNQITIERGVPIPAGRLALGGDLARLRAALTGMTPGDSFTWPANKAAWLAARQAGVAIKTRKIDGGYRIWRTA